MAQYNETLIKFAYLTYEDILSAVSNGTLQPYDIVYCKDTREQFVISVELKPIATKAKTPIYNSVSEANEKINKDTSTYIGELVSIVEGNVCSAYTIQIDPITTKLFVAPVSSFKELRGISTSPIYIEDLSDGNYVIKGVFIFDGNRETSLIGNHFIVETVSGIKYITRVSANNIQKYTVNKSTVTKTEYVTTEYLESKGFIEKKNLDKEVSSLGYIKKKDIKTDIKEVVDESVNEAIDEKLVRITEEEIDNMFQNTTK